MCVGTRNRRHFRLFGPTMLVSMKTQQKQKHQNPAKGIQTWFSLLLDLNEMHIYHGGKQMISDEVDSNDWGERMICGKHTLIHDDGPALLSQDLEHGHKCLKKQKKTSGKQSMERKTKTEGRE